MAGVGDVSQEQQGGTQFDPGDGSGLIGTPVAISGSRALLYLVTSVDTVNNWMFGVAVDASSLPLPAGCGNGNAPSTCDTIIEHTYASAGLVTAQIEDCCRFSPCVAPNAHINNPDNGYRVQTTVDVGTGNSSPVSSLPPIIICPQEGVCTFTVPVSDDDLDPLSFRLATDAEAGFDQVGNSSGPGQGQPGTAAGCAGNASIDSSTGVYTWDTHGCTLAGDPGPAPPNGGCNNSSLNTLYSSQVMIEETGRGTKVALDFLIELVPVCLGNAPPAFDQPPTPPCGSALSVNPLSPLTFTVQASDADDPSVEINATALPSGATLTPALPVNGNPVSTVFSWTPTLAQIGQHVVTFTAKDQCPEQVLCSITIDVSQENCTDGIDNDSDSLVDCADPDCQGTPCDDGDACTTNDSCNQGTASCLGGPPPNCDDGNVCTGDSCDSGSGCVHLPLDGSPCRPAAGDCDIEEVCDGSTCPADVKSTSECRAANGACDVAESCDGVGDDCPPDGVAPMGSQCRAAVGDCDVAESCDGTGADCPADGFASAGTACDDGSACTTDEACDGNGACVGSTPPNCDDGDPCTRDSCDPGQGCQNDETPLESCRLAQKSIFIVKSRGQGKDRLIWKWIRGDTPVGEFGDPTASTDYALCVYDESGAVPGLSMKSLVAGGGDCAGKPCWKQIGSTPRGFRYKDRSLSRDGTLAMVLKGGKPGRDRIIFKAKGDNIPLPVPASADQFFQQDSDVTVQLVNGEGACWGAVYTPNDKITNRGSFYRGKVKSP